MKEILRRFEQDLNLEIDDDLFGSGELLLGVFSHSSELLILTEEGKTFFESWLEEAGEDITVSPNYGLELLLEKGAVEIRKYSWEE